MNAVPVLTALDVNFLGHRQRHRLLPAGGRPDGVALVDPGPTHEPGRACGRRWPAKGRGLADVDTILLTHIHLDHAGGTGRIVREHPRVQVYVHERGAPHMIDPVRLMNSAARLYGADMERLWGEMAPVPAANVHVLSGGETMRAAGRGSARGVHARPRVAPRQLLRSGDANRAGWRHRAAFASARWSIVLPPDAASRHRCRGVGHQPRSESSPGSRRRSSSRTSAASRTPARTW